MSLTWMQVTGALLPTFFYFFVGSLVLCSAFWFLTTKVHNKIQFHFMTPVLGSVFVTGLYVLNSFMNISMNKDLYVAQQDNRPQAVAQNPDGRNPQSVPPQQQQQVQQQQPQAQAQPVDPAVQLKSEFLTQVNSLMSQPDLYSDAIKAQLLQKYQGVFAGGESKKSYYGTLSALLTCEKSYFEDALESYKKSKVVTSKNRKKCADQDGHLFNREKLFPPALAQSYEGAIEILAGVKPPPQGAADNYKTMTLENIKGHLAAYDKKMKVLKSLFE